MVRFMLFLPGRIANQRLLLYKAVPMGKKPAQEMLSDAALEIIASRFRLLSEPTRLKLIHVLRKKRRTVNELVALTGKSQAHVSRQLKALADAGILARERVGVSVYYSIGEPAILELCHHVCSGLTNEFQRRGVPVPTRSA